MTNIAKVTIVLCSIFYLFWDIDFSYFFESVKAINPLGFFTAFAVMVLSIFIVSIRWQYLSKYSLSIKSSFESVILCLGINNITPLKLGEIAKTVYLKKVYHFPISRSLPMMVLERFFDLLVLAILMVFASYYLELSLYIVLIFICTTTIILYLVSKNPKQILFLLFHYFPKKIKKFSMESVKTVARIGTKEWFVIFLYSISIWLLYYFIYYTFAYFGANLILSPLEILIIFIAASIGMSIPSSPGGIGVVEASIVFALGRFGVGKEEALCFAIVLRMIQYIPTTLFTLYIILKSDFSLKSTL